MKLIWKIIIGIVLFGIIIITGGIAWLYKQVKVDHLKVDKQDDIHQKIEKADIWLNQLQEANKFNGAVLLIKNDSVLHKKVYGYTDYSKQEKLTTQSSFRLGSLSKQFTASGIMILKEKGILSFDDPIIKFLPTLPYYNVTIRHLLNHTSGIPDVYMGYPEKYPEEVKPFLTNSKVVSLLSKHKPELVTPPNEAYEYSNIGYVLLSAIIESVSGESFETFMHKELFKPLGMKNTRVRNLLSQTKTFENKTSSFDVDLLGNNSPLKPGLLDGVSGDGAVFSSIDDFIIWNDFWYNNSILSQETIQEAFKQPILNNGEKSNYGFGWLIAPNAVMHNGSWLGARTQIIRNFSLKNTIVILDSSSSLLVDQISEELTKVYK